MFARSEYDFGDFTVLVYEIDTGEPPPPFKEKMRRKPPFFAGQEEKCHPALYIRMGFRFGAD